MLEAESVERNVSGLKVRIERTICIGSGSCVKIAPDVFELDQESVTSFVVEPCQIDRERLLEACELCPVNALIVFDASGKQLVP